VSRIGVAGCHNVLIMTDEGARAKESLMRDAKLYLVEGKGTVNDPLKDAIRRADFSLEVFHTGTKAIAFIRSNRPDLVIVDASSLRSSGARTSSRIRKILGDCPIIHCRRYGTDEDRSAEADVYLVRPFTARKVMNRVRALLPADDMKVEIVRIGEITFYPSKRSVDIPGRGEQRLTPKMASLLNHFLLQPNQILSRHFLMEYVWDTNYFGDTRTLDVHIRWIREIIERNPAKPILLRTLRGVGYIFSIPD